MKFNKKWLVICVASLTLVTMNNYSSKQKAEIVSESLQNKPLVKTSPKQGIVDVSMLSLIDQMNERRKTEQASEPKNLTISRGNSSMIFEVTAYDLSIQSCGKPLGHKDYGKTKSGLNLSWKTWDTARAISVDPKIIPLGKKAYLEFMDDKHKKYNGVYTAVDTGAKIKNNKIDFFMGDFRSNKPSPQALEFGRTKAKVTILN